MGHSLTEYQNTLADRISLSGVGVHSGKPVSISLLPADADTGVTFVRTDVPVEKSVDIAGHISAVSATALCTVLGKTPSVNVMTVEHLMAALSAIGVDNVMIELDSAEVPVMDGSSEVFVEAIDRIGLKRQSQRRRYIRILKEKRINIGASWGMFLPHDSRRFEVEIDFAEEIIGRQKFSGDLSAGLFRGELSRARTFGFMKDVERYWAAGFALGSSLENSVVIGDDNRIINPEGLRYKDEFVRHKTLDTIGDLALAGAPILGCFRSYRGGHKLNAMALQALFADESAYEYTEVHKPHVRSSGAKLMAVNGPAFAADKS